MVGWVGGCVRVGCRAGGWRRYLQLVGGQLVGLLTHAKPRAIIVYLIPPGLEKRTRDVIPESGSQVELAGLRRRQDPVQHVPRRAHASR